MSKLQDDLAAEIAPWSGIAASVDALLISLARRIEDCRCDPVKLSDLASLLREDSTKVIEAVLAKPVVPITSDPPIAVEQPVAVADAAPAVPEQASPELSAVLEGAVSAALEG